MKTNEIRFKTFKHLNVNYREIKDEDIIAGYGLMGDDFGSEKLIRQYEDIGSVKKNVNGWSLCKDNLIFDKDSKVEFNNCYLRENTAHKIKIKLEEGADVKCCFFYDMEDCDLIADIDIEVGKGAKINFAPIILKGNRVYMNISAHLFGEGSVMNMEAAYVAAEDADVDINLDLVHDSKSTESELNMNGVLLENSRKTYKYSIDFPRGSTHSKGVESETTIAMTDNFRNTTVPILLVGEDMIEAEHGATLTELDSDILDYISSRGIGEKMAKFMVVEAQFANAVDMCSGTCKNKILNRLEETFLGDAN